MLPEAEGGDGELTYSLAPALPAGLSFAADTRTLSGTPTAAGEYAMTYTAADEDGDEASFGFTLTVDAVPPTAKQAQVPQPSAPTLTRVQFSGQSAPALDVTWPHAGANVAEYRVKYGKKGDEANWAWTHIDDPNNRTLRMSNLEPGELYEAQVQAIADSVNSEWSATGEGRANRPPAATSASFNGGTFPVGTIADYKETGQGAVGVLFSDADSDALTYSAAAQHAALLGVSLTGNAGEAQLRVTLLNQGSSNVTYTARDAYGGSVTRTATIGITAKTSRSVAENSPAGTAVGTPVTGTPYNNVALSYTLTGNAADSGLFVIDSSTGQISVKQGATLDYETDDSYRETETWNGQVSRSSTGAKCNTPSMGMRPPLTSKSS